MTAPHTGAGAPPAPLRIAYARRAPAELLAEPDVLAVLGFGARDPRDPDDPRWLRVPLAPLGAAPLEVWRGRGPVRSGATGAIRWASDGDYLFASIQLDEAAHGGIAGAAESAYRELGRFLATAVAPHVLRLWNYFDAINAGEGDAERYRLFCNGRGRGMSDLFRAGYPAATAIGFTAPGRRLLVYALASRAPGTAIENPRQVSAWRYPREYGPTAPAFARAMRGPAPQLFVSGTAAVVGHASRHAGDCAAQLDETLANLDSLLGAAGTGIAAHFGPHSRLKVYLRDPAEAARVVALLHQRLPNLDDFVLLHSDICRRELLVEIDGVHA